MQISSTTSLNKIYKNHHRSFRMTYSEYDKSYEELFQLNNNNASIHQRHLKYLPFDVFKSITDLNPEFTWSNPV